MSVADCPEQIVAEFTVTAGFGFTLTEATAVLEQPDVVPVTVYDVLLAGETPDKRLENYPLQYDDAREFARRARSLERVA